MRTRKLAASYIMCYQMYGVSAEFSGLGTILRRHIKETGFVITAALLLFCRMVKEENKALNKLIETP